MSLADKAEEVHVIAPLFVGLRHGFKGLRQLVSQSKEFVDCNVRTRLIFRPALWGKFPKHHHHVWLKYGEKDFESYIRSHGRPDLIHAHCTFHAGALARRLSAKLRIPYVITEHSTAFERGLIQGWQNDVVKSVFSNAAARICVSPSLGQHLESRYGNSVQPWFWVPNLVNDRFCVDPTTVRNRSSRPKKFCVLNVALLTEKKGHITLLKAVKQLAAQGIDIELRIVGDGPLKSKLENQCKQLGISDRIRWRGRLNREAVACEMKKADCFILPSHHETFGVVLIEALASGVPVIATSCGGPDCIVKPEDGLLVDPKSSVALAHAMRSMWENLSSYDCPNIAKRCQLRFGAEQVASQLMDIYEKSISL